MIEQRTIHANGLDHHLRIAGTGESAMVMLHGWPETSYCWRHVMAALGDDFRMIAPDLRGFGDSAKPEGHHDKATVAGDIWAIMDGLEIERAVLVGHDIGARVAMRMTLDHPHRVASLVVINGRYPPLGGLKTTDKSQAQERWYFFFQQYPDLVEKLVSKDVRAYYEHFLDHWSHPDFHFTEEEIQEYVRAYSQPGAIRGGCAHYQAALNEDEQQWAADVGKTVETPTLVIWGQDDVVSPPFYTEGYDEVFSDIDIRFVTPCGHFPQEERPDDTIAAMKEFLSEPSRRP